MKINIEVDPTSERELEDRAQRLKPIGPPIQLTPLERAVQFLRGVNSRATTALPAFYLFHAATLDEECALDGYPGVVLKSAIQFSSIGTVSLACRQTFDDARSGLTGKNFAKTSDEILIKVAEYWSGKSDRAAPEALSALVLLRSISRIAQKQTRRC